MMYVDNKTNSQNLFTMNIVLKTIHSKHYLQFISIKEKLFSSANVFNSIKEIIISIIIIIIIIITT